MRNHHAQEIKQSLIALGVSEHKIDFSVFGSVAKFSRLNFIKTLSITQNLKNTKGAVAELGVWKGETAKYINLFFDESFYLLDTFEGFDKKDIKQENTINGAIQATDTDFSDISLEEVRLLMPHINRCHFIKGYFPDTTQWIPKEEKFRFVNLDVDLYQPISAGLKYFYPRLVKNGVILIHDYFHPYYKGVKRAVDEFCYQNNTRALPIGDAFSVMIIKL